MKEYNWNDAPVICTLDGYNWLLGPEAPERLNWDEAKKWGQSVGGELPPREILLICYLKTEIRITFKPQWYWSSTEFSATYAWVENFSDGYQYSSSYKNLSGHVRAVRACDVGE